MLPPHILEVVAIPWALAFAEYDFSVDVDTLGPPVEVAWLHIFFKIMIFNVTIDMALDTLQISVQLNDPKEYNGLPHLDPFIISQVLT